MKKKKDLGVCGVGGSWGAVEKASSLDNTSSDFYLLSPFLPFQFSCNSHLKVKTEISINHAHLEAKLDPVDKF